MSNLPQKAGLIRKLLEAAYMDKSSGGTLPVNIRQLFYGVRPGLLKAGWLMKEKGEYKYFCRVAVAHIEDAYPEWDVVFDNRGAAHEPQTGKSVPLGTLSVRDYIDSWKDTIDGSMSDLRFVRLFGTRGPTNRYRYALFLEKETFNTQIIASGMVEKYDLMLMSTKGTSVVACRQLVQELSRNGIQTLVARDFDLNGFNIAHTLGHDTDRFKYDGVPLVTDLGLRLEHIKEMGLDSEPVTYPTKDKPHAHLLKYGATVAECDHLCSKGKKGAWEGRRVEMDAMSSRQFLDWLEARLLENGVEKYIPDDDAILEGYRRALCVKALEKVAKEVCGGFDALTLDDLPDGLLSDMHDHKGDEAWDEYIYDLIDEA